MSENKTEETENSPNIPELPRMSRNVTGERLVEERPRWQLYREMGLKPKQYEAIIYLIHDGMTIAETARQIKVNRKTVSLWRNSDERDEYLVFQHCYGMEQDAQWQEIDESRALRIQRLFETCENAMSIDLTKYYQFNDEGKLIGMDHAGMQKDPAVRPHRLRFKQGFDKQGKEYIEVDLVCESPARYAHIYGQGVGFGRENPRALQDRLDAVLRKLEGEGKTT